MTTIDTFSPLKAEHEALRPRVESLRVAAEAVDLPSAHDTFELVDDAWRFLTSHLTFIPRPRKTCSTRR
jgi:hypothetical protein